MFYREIFKERMNMKFCSNCGKQLNDDAMFCSGCGSKQVAAPTTLHLSITTTQRPFRL